MLYNVAVRDLKLALGIRPNRCPATNFSEIQERRAKMENNLVLSQDRILTLGNDKSKFKKN